MIQLTHIETSDEAGEIIWKSIFIYMFDLQKFQQSIWKLTVHNMLYEYGTPNYRALLQTTCSTQIDLHDIWCRILKTKREQQ